MSLFKWFKTKNKHRDDPATRESRAALDRAKEAEREVQSRWDEVVELSESLKGMRKRNHFGEQLEMIMRNRSTR